MILPSAIPQLRLHLSNLITTLPGDRISLITVAMSSQAKLVCHLRRAQEATLCGKEGQRLAAPQYFSEGRSAKTSSSADGHRAGIQMSRL